VDTVLGVSMAPTAVRIVLVEGQNADGATVDEDNFAVINGDDPATFSGPDQVVAAILGTREGANEAGYDLLSTGVTWSDQCEATELRDALAARKVENVMLVSSFLAAAALAQSIGSATGYAMCCASNFPMTTIKRSPRWSAWFLPPRVSTSSRTACWWSARESTSR
jgi:hypothetical protein